MKSLRILGISIVFLFTSGTTALPGTEVFSTGLKSPTKIILTTRGNLLVSGSEATPNSGQVTLVQRNTGEHRPVLTGLPSALDFNGDPSGTTALLLDTRGAWAMDSTDSDTDEPTRSNDRERSRGDTLIVLNGEGGVVVQGGTPGTFAPNPKGPPSPIVSSVIVAQFDRSIDRLASGFSLSISNHFELADGYDVTLENAEGARVRLRLLADFRDYVPDPVSVVRHSNPFGVVRLGFRLYVADASKNAIVGIDRLTGRTRTLVTFPNLANPQPGGPPEMEPVPDSIRVWNNQLFVSFLVGFPFPPGASRIEVVDPRTGEHQVVVEGLTSTVDLLLLPTRRSTPGFLILEFSVDQLNGAPGRLLYLSSETSEPETLASDLTSPTSMARDNETGEIFITEIFTGQIIRVPGPVKRTE